MMKKLLLLHLNSKQWFIIVLILAVLSDITQVDFAEAVWLAPQDRQVSPQTQSYFALAIVCPKKLWF